MGFTKSGVLRNFLTPHRRLALRKGRLENQLRPPLVEAVTESACDRIHGDQYVDREEDQQVLTTKPLKCRTVQQTNFCVNIK